VAVYILLVLSGLVLSTCGILMFALGFYEDHEDDDTFFGEDKK